MLFFPEIRRMKHPRCFPKFACCSPTASAWCAVATRPLRYISQNHVCAFCFVSNFRPSKHCFEKCSAKAEQQPHTTRTQLADAKRAWLSWGSGEGASFFVFPVQDSHLFEFPFSWQNACFLFWSRFPFVRNPICSRRYCRVGYSVKIIKLHWNYIAG